MKNQKLKPLKNIDLLSELSSDEDLNVIKTNNLFRGYAMSYKVEIIEKKDPIKQLEASNKDLKSVKKSQREKLNLDQFISIQHQKQ